MLYSIETNNNNSLVQWNGVDEVVLKSLYYKNLLNRPYLGDLPNQIYNNSVPIIPTLVINKVKLGVNYSVNFKYIWGMAFALLESFVFIGILVAVGVFFGL